jgi:hypothetical protein
VGPRAGLYDVEKRKFLTLPGLEIRPFGRPTRSQSLYRLCYPSSFIHLILDQKLDYNGTVHRMDDIRCSHSSDYEDYCHQECDAMYSDT